MDGLVASLPPTIAWGTWAARPGSRSTNAFGQTSPQLGRPGTSGSSTPAGGGAGAAARARRKKLARLNGDSDCTQVCMRPGQILVPGLGASNDMTRAKNGGQRRGSWVEALAATASEPWLNGHTATPAAASSAWGCGSTPFTPRTLRGAVRKSANLDMAYPRQPSDRPSSTNSRPPSVGAKKVGVSKSTSLEPQSTHQKPATTLSKINTMSCVDEEQEEPMSSAGRRSVELLHTFYKVRRAGAMQEADECPDVNLEQVLMTTTLGDTEDTADSLGKLEELLECGHESIQPLGGARHATSVISQRTLDVVRRKRQLLVELEDRILDFKAAQALSEVTLECIKKDAEYKPPKDLLDINKAATKKLHKNGNPADECKIDFPNFASTFGLPRGHVIFRRMEEVASEAISWWANAAVMEAKAGVETEVIQRIINLASSILGQPDHEAIRRSRSFLGKTIAENTMHKAGVLVEKDKRRVETSAKAQPDSARITADLINQEIKAAVAMGAPPTHRSLVHAKRMADAMTQEMKDRMARKVLEFAVSQKQKDEVTVLRSIGMPQVGPAAWAADAIDRELRKALDAEVPDSHPLLDEVREVIRLLRVEDNNRKRQAGRESRNFRNV